MRTFKLGTLSTLTSLTPLNIMAFSRCDAFCCSFRRDATNHLAYISAEAPKLTLDELFSPSMALNGYKNFFTDTPTPEHHIEHSYTLSANGNIRSPSAEPRPNQQTPTRLRPRSDSRLGSPPPPDPDCSFSSSQPPSELDTPISGVAGLPWSAAVGRATTGKSGRVIEKLMGENDRLQREKTLATVKLEEEVKRSESARSALESLQVSNSNLISIHETDKSSLAKKDRRIEDLRADLEAERSRREKAERGTRESRRERDDVVGRLRKEAAEDRQQAQRASSQYDVLSRSWKSIEERYEKQTAKLKADMKILQKEIEGDKTKLSKLEVILEQLTREGDKGRKAKEKLSSDFQAYKAEQEAGIQAIRQKADRNSTAHDRTLEQMQSVLGEMRYVVNIQKDVHRVMDPVE